MLLKKSKKIVLVLIAVIAILLAFVGGQAYAKYMSRISGKGTADIASWSFKANENEEKMQTISLKSKMNNSTLDANGSDVGINYVIKFENETSKPTNLKFTYDGKTYNSLTELQKDLTGTIDANGQDKTKTLTVGWNWKYETGSTQQEIATSDAIDTKEAKTISNYTFDVIISGTQVMPQN